MKIILIANPKGGSGKSTLAAHIAGYWAWQGERVMLGDLDRQHSAKRWLALRPDRYPTITGWEVKDGEPAKPPKETTAAVLDSPAGLHGKRLEAALKVSNRILVPVQPAAFDMWASADFFRLLAEEKAVRKGQVEVAVVGMRVNPRTQAAKQLDAFLREFDLPVLTQIRDTQLYVQLQPRGLTLFDLPKPRFERDYAQWAPILNWLK
ncbi:ParA family protein [Andreprevotia chitinilytica]|uniref:ParA family protein n=1 Tax=Andreprevotia chitinilytica TaxID=396808 RepID=UPI00055610ED|nr:ParA family protein [Andreprevotia chitinilytica]